MGTDCASRSSLMSMPLMPVYNAQSASTVVIVCESDVRGCRDAARHTTIDLGRNRGLHCHFNVRV